MLQKSILYGSVTKPNRDADAVRLPDFSEIAALQAVQLPTLQFMLHKQGAYAGNPQL
jgi:hypothetical protein